MKRFLKRAGIVLGLLVLSCVGLGLFARPKSYPVSTPSGRKYDLLVDQVSADGRYYVKYLAHSSDPDKIEEGADDLMRLVASSPRAANLKTISIEANVGSGVGAFTVYRGYGYVFENHDGKWQRAGKNAIHDSIVGSGLKDIGVTRN